MTGTMNNPGTVIMKVADLGIMMLVAEVDEGQRRYAADWPAGQGSRPGILGRGV